MLPKHAPPLNNSDAPKEKKEKEKKEKGKRKTTYIQFIRSPHPLHLIRHRVLHFLPHKLIKLLGIVEVEMMSRLGNHHDARSPIFSPFLLLRVMKEGFEPRFLEFLLRSKPACHIHPVVLAVKHDDWDTGLTDSLGLGLRYDLTANPVDFVDDWVTSVRSGGEKVGENVLPASFLPEDGKRVFMESPRFFGW